MSKDNVSFRERWAARWRGFSDAWRDVSINSEEIYVNRSLDHLIARQNTLMRKYAFDLVEETQGCVVPMERLRNAIRPAPSNNLGEAGRSWHNYQLICTDGKAAADRVIGRHQACQVSIDEARATAQAIIDRYVAVVKRFHPRRASLTEWNLEVPIPPEHSRTIEERYQLALAVLKVDTGYTDRSN